MTFGEVLARSVAWMEAEEEQQERDRRYERAYRDWCAGRPTGLRNPRKRLRRWLAGCC